MLLFFNARKNSSLLNHEVVFIAFMTQRIPNIIKSCSLFHHLKRKSESIYNEYRGYICIIKKIKY